MVILCFLLKELLPISLGNSLKKQHISLKSRPHFGRVLLFRAGLFKLTASLVKISKVNVSNTPVFFVEKM